jgi:hypothetical protein
MLKEKVTIMKVSKSRLVKGLVIGGVVVLLLATAGIALANHLWTIKSATCDYNANTVKVCGSLGDGSSDDTEIYVNGVLIGYYNQNFGPMNPACLTIQLPVDITPGDVVVAGNTIETSTPSSATCSAGGNGCADDGRVNTNCSAPEILYCGGDTLKFYAYNTFTGEGDFDFSVKQSDLPESVSKETLVKQDGSVKLYMEPDGTFKLLAPQPDGKIYFMIFDTSDCTSLREGAEWNLK